MKNLDKNDGSSIASIFEECGFEAPIKTDLDEIDGVAFSSSHRLSGARLLFLKNDDEEKAFSITFKTPAFDNSGVFHILEHSVLCGSRKFPVKEPFVNLLKGSMQTFLNAMTFPDKTMYPVASTNEKDLLNLMDVYLDAVFHPNIYTKREIFEQEGWHFELGSIQAGEDAAADAGLQFNGVVFNEMKGALATPESVLFNTLSSALFPDTTYAFESGGLPEEIPNLSYEDFIATHRKYYCPANSYIVLYGNIDCRRVLKFLDEEYLTPVAKEISEREGEIVTSAVDSYHIDLQSPRVCDGIVRKMQTSPDGSCAAFGYVVGKAPDPIRETAIGILLSAIMGSNASPLKHAILESGIADNCEAHLIDSVAQPYVVLQIKGLHDSAVQKLKEVVRKTCEDLSSGGLDHALIEAALTSEEFASRERNFGVADGVYYSIAALASWLYGGSPLDYIKYGPVFEAIHQRLDQGYFEDLVRKIFLDNDHWAQVEIEPVERLENDPIETVLSGLSRDLTEARKSEIQSDVARLRSSQAEPDSDAALASLPRLQVSDIGDAKAEPAFGIIERDSLQIVEHGVKTRGISYFYRYYNLSDIPYRELGYVSLLCSTLGKLDTASHTAIELDTLCGRYLGNIYFSIRIFNDIDSKGFRCMFEAGASSLGQNAPWAARLTDEILHTTNFHDAPKLREILVQMRVAFETRLITSGNSIASNRAQSYCLPSAVLGEKVSGVDFYSFLCDLTDNFGERFEGLADRLDSLSHAIFKEGAYILSFGGESGTLDSYLDEREKGQSAGSDVEKRQPASDETLWAFYDQSSLPVPQYAHEAFIVPSDVNYVALCLPGAVELPYTSDWMVADRVLSLDYLWQRIRVEGGAYGTGISTNLLGNTSIYSYRDPHLDETVASFLRCGEWLGDAEISSEEFTGYVVSCAAKFDAPQKPREIIRVQDRRLFSGDSYEEHIKRRAEVISCKPGQIVKIGRELAEKMENAVICCVGNADSIGKSKSGFKVVELFKK